MSDMELNFCCRDDNGAFQGSAERIDSYFTAGDICFCLESCFHPARRVSMGYYSIRSGSTFNGANGTRFHRGTRAVMLSDARWVKVGAVWMKIARGPCSGGNIYWDTIGTSPDYVCALLNYLRRYRDNWSMSEAVSALFEWWRSAEPPLTAEQFAAIVSPTASSQPQPSIVPAP